MLTERLADRLVAEFGPRVTEQLGIADGAAFIARLRTGLPDVERTLDQLYGGRTDTTGLIRALISDVLKRAADRPELLRKLDRTRSADPAWFQSNRMVGYVCYADRFAGTLSGVRSRLDYLADLGVTYLHLMPVLKPRPGPNDGGYAVADYDAVDPRLGTMAELTGLAEDLHARDMSLCVDLVLNHTAREHEWARKAAAGDPFYRDFYFIFPDRRQPDAFGATLPDIFPELAPGSFSYDAEVNGWVWTTFYEFQWDLDYGNPEVFRAMLDTMLRLANRGADVLRLDAAPFLWKRLGTDCQNQPEAHLVLQAFRALTRLAAPGLLLKAEAMVAPEILASYLGRHEEYRPECDVAYDNQLMVMLWSAVADGDARLAAQALGRRAPAPDPTSWVTYIRCHDDIGWAVSDVDAAAIGRDGPAVRRRLSDFYAGNTADSFARGQVFQVNATGASPTSGTLASLCGVQAAIETGDASALELALRRLESLYSVVYSFGGIPLLYMGDELGLLNAPIDDPSQQHDNRWIHRPPMDWTASGAAPGSVAGRSLRALRALAAARTKLDALAGTAPTTVLSGDNGLLVYRRGDGPSAVLAAVNFATTPGALELEPTGLADPVLIHATVGTESLDLDGRSLIIPACGFVWLKDADR